MPISIAVSEAQEAEALKRAASPVLPGCSAQQVVMAVDAVFWSLRKLLTASAVAYLQKTLAQTSYEVFAESAEPADDPTGDDSLVNLIAERLPGAFPAHPCLVARVVLADLAQQVGPDEVKALMEQMPDRLRKLWPAEYWMPAMSRRAA